MLFLFLSQEKTYKRLILFIISIVIFSYLYSVMCDAEKDFYYGIYPKPKDSVLDNYIDYLYFSAQIQSTLGFGDMAPKTNKTRILVILQLLFSFIIFNINI